MSAPIDDQSDRHLTGSAFGPDDPIVAIGAHFDDIELGCGGTLAKVARRGCPVTMVTMTTSQYTHAGGGIHRSASVALGEGVKAAAALGISDVRCLNLANRNLAWDGETVAAIEAVLTEVKPALIFTHWPFDTHQDHHFGSLATLSAARYFPSLLMYDPMYPSGRSYQPFRAQVYFDISDTIDQKLEAIHCHACEHAKYGQDWLEAVRARARLRGYETGVRYAEAFEAVRLRIRL
jgi:LmbE family N-acetylglucosaminyl deacetylase